MSEDWRVKVEFHEEEHGRRLTGFLHSNELEHDLAERLHGRVVVSQDGPLLFLYAETRDQAEAAMQVVNSFLSDHAGDAQAAAEVELTRWHEVEERWEDPSKALPDTPEGVKAERDKLTETERAESAYDKMDEWEVQIVLPDHGSTKALAKKLEGEGLKPLRRWRFLVIPVPSEDDGNQLAERLKGEVPAEARIAVEASYGEVIANAPGSRAFSLFGGLGG
ncbi:MAG TPA: hypothetical protein VGF74_03625 [Thermoleophilaceae bacterium]|jgi:hypothetical protein